MVLNTADFYPIMNRNLARDSNSRKPIFDEEKARVDPGGAEYSGRRPSPKLYEADNEVCRIEGASLSLHQEFY